MTGGCQCGAIRYEITSFPLLLYTCNCTDCQRQAGSAFALNMPVRFKDFRILQGSSTHHPFPTNSLAQENSSHSKEPAEAMGNYRWFGRLFWSSRLRKGRGAEFGAWMTSWPAGSHGSTVFLIEGAP